MEQWKIDKQCSQVVYMVVLLLLLLLRIFVGIFLVKIRNDSWTILVNEPWDLWLGSALPRNFRQFLFHKFVAGMRFACIFIIKIASAVRSAVDLEQSLGMIGQGMQKAKKSMLFEFHQKV